MTSNAQNRLPENLKDDAGKIREDLSQLKDDLRQTGQHAMAHGKELGEKVMERGKEQAEHLRERVHDGMDYARDYAREKPLMVVGAAFGIGILAGLLLCRR